MRQNMHGLTRPVPEAAAKHVVGASKDRGKFLKRGRNSLLASSESAKQSKSNAVSKHNMAKTGPKSATFELSEKAHPYIPVSTTKILWNYTRDPPPDIPNEVLQERRAGQQEHSKTVEELRKWFKLRESGILPKVLRRIFLRDVKIRMPAEEKLYGAINHFFPPRSDIRVTVCDFGPGRAERKEVRLGDVEKGKTEFSIARGQSIS
jgi:hypothetical protein